jgi:iron complex outermembrane receptor protein
MKQLVSILFLFLLSSPVLIFGQRTISGTVTDAETGEGLIGANVILEGTLVGVATDFDGNYTLQLTEESKNLVFSYTGYGTVIIPIGASDQINAKLSSGSILDEVVVIGYGTVKREDATGSVQSVASKDFNRGAITSPQELLSGKVAGVQISTGGDPGGGSTIRIRGGSSLSASNDPLIVIDGVPIAPGGVSGSRNPLNLINPNDIETMTVLKDASATAIYGSRASNGVILITTKKGKLGKKININYNGNIGFSSRTNEIDVLDANTYRQVIEDQFDEGHPSREILGDANTDWQDEVYQTALFHDHNINFSGGIGVVPYRVSLGYTDKEGILKTDQFQRTTVGVNLSPGLLDNTLQINIGFKGSFSNNDFADRGAIGNAVRMDPTQPTTVDSEDFGGYYTWLQANGNGQPNGLAPTNPLALLFMKEDVSDVQRYIANATFDYRFSFLPELRANLNLALDRSKGEGSIDVPTTAPFAFNPVEEDGGVMNTYSQSRENDLLEFYLNYVKEFDTHKIDLMGGYSWQHFYDESEFFNSNFSGSIITEGEDLGELYLLSLFGRLNYTFQDRYLFTFTLRRDGTSRFSPDTRWGLFPAAAFAYKIIDDQEGFLNNLKLRLGYGVTGQQDVGGFYISQARYLSSFDNAQYPFGGTPFITLRPEGYDANIKWEETTTYNAGIDFGLWGERLTGSIDYYRRETRDLINFIPVPAGTNFANAIVTNVGDLENTGVELAINITPINKSDMYWDFGFNVAMNNNKITRLTATEDPAYQGVLTGGISGGVGNTIQIHSVGFPASSFYVYEQVYDETGNPIEGEYVDRNGDGMVTPDDRYQTENPAPDLLLGFTSMFTYKDFELSFAGRGNFGNYVYNNVQSERGTYQDLYQSTRFLTNIHTHTFETNFDNQQLFSDLYLYDASFLRFDHITLGYNFRNLANGKIPLLKVFAVAQNPFVITGYDGLDPEVFGGIDGNIYPRSRTFLFGVNLNL